MSADLAHVPPEIVDDVLETAFWDPVADRRFVSYLSGGEKLHQDVGPNTELLENYLGLLTVDNWSDKVARFRAQCSGETTG